MDVSSKSWLFSTKSRDRLAEQQQSHFSLLSCSSSSSPSFSTHLNTGVGTEYSFKEFKVFSQAGETGLKSRFTEIIIPS
jgi:hypothetical protein